MARTLNSPVGDQRSEIAYLIALENSGGTIRVTTASADIAALSETWTAIGGRLIHAGAPETADRKAQGIELELWGVDQTIIQAIQNNQFRGRPVQIWLLHFDPDTGAQDTPDLIFQGRQNDDFTVSETRDHDNPESGGVVKVSTRISADTSAINRKVSTRCNVHSHEELLRRSGVGAPDDKFFSRVASLVNKDVYWGTLVPSRNSGGHGRVPEDDETQLLGWR